MLKAKVLIDGRNMFVVVNGVKIAKRGKPGTARASKWVSLEPGHTVLDGPNSEIMIIGYRDGRQQ